MSQVIWNKYYISEWSGLQKTEAYAKSRRYENEVINILLQRSGFTQVIPTRDSIIARSKERYITRVNGMSVVVLPDLFGAHFNGRNYFIEVKRKNRRLRFNDTGFDIKHINSYLTAQKDFSARIVVLFKDNKSELELEGVKSWFLNENGNEEWYGEFLDDLNEKTPTNSITTFPDPHTGALIKCFPLRMMKKVDNIWKSRQTQLNLLPPAF